MQYTHYQKVLSNKLPAEPASATFNLSARRLQPAVPHEPIWRVGSVSRIRSNTMVGIYGLSGEELYVEPISCNRFVFPV